jgi:cytochrome bd ubiquinol oxidase subunit I
LLSFLVHHNPALPVPGLRELPPKAFMEEHNPGSSDTEMAAARKDYWPNVPMTFFFFHVMILVGSLLLVIVLAAIFLWFRGMLFRTDLKITRIFLWILTFSVLGPQICNQAGWFTAEDVAGIFQSGHRRGDPGVDHPFCSCLLPVISCLHLSADQKNPARSGRS